MWKEYVNSISKEHHFKDPATKFEITQIQKELNIVLPEELAALFNETNGVFDNWNCPLIWSTPQIIKDNVYCKIEVQSVAKQQYRKLQAKIHIDLSTILHGEAGMLAYLGRAR